MTGFVKITIQRLVVGLILIGIAGCARSAQETFAPSHTASPAPIPSFTVSTVETLTSSPLIPEFSGPFWLGRGRIIDAAFLPGAQQVAVAWANGISLHAVGTGEEIWFTPAPSNLLAFGAQSQGEHLAAALADGSVMVLAAKSGDAKNYSKAPPDAYWGDLAWSPNGDWIAFQFIGNRRSDPVMVLDVTSGSIRQVPDSITGAWVIPVVIWSPDGRSVTIASHGEYCSRFVDIERGETLMPLGSSGRCYGSVPLSFLPGGQSLAVNGLAGGVDILSFPEGELIRRLENDGTPLIAGPVADPYSSGIIFSDPEGKWLASRGGYGPCNCGNPQDQPYHPLVVWELESGQILGRLDRAIDPLANRRRVASTFDGERILLLYESGEITHWDFLDPQGVETLIGRIPVMPPDHASLRWSADGTRLAFSGAFGGVDIYDTVQQQLVQRFDPPLVSPALSPDGSQVAMYDPEQRMVVVFNVEDGKERLGLAASPTLMGAAFSPDGLYLVYGSGGQVLVAEVSSGRTLALDPSVTAPVSAEMELCRAIWSPDGRALATAFARPYDGNGPGVIVLWKRLADGGFQSVNYVLNAQANYTLPNMVLAVFDPSGRRAALESMPAAEAGQASLVVYDLSAGEVVASLPGYKPAAWLNAEVLLAAEAQFDTRLTSVNLTSGEMIAGGAVDRGDTAYHPSGRLIARAADPPRRGVTVIDWQSGKEIAQLPDETVNLHGYGWSPDGRWLASLGGDGSLRLWRLETP